MDLNIGAALWLAARAEGSLRVYRGGSSTDLKHSLDGARYKSAARVVLVGHGADEQCAGYGRHRTKFRQAVRMPPPSPLLLHRSLHTD
jgi:asparagine synthetase B (glutamine-hydrolysing)